MAAYESDGFQSIEVLIENNYGSAPSQAELGQWANTAGLQTVPVLNDGAYTNWVQYEKDFYIPTTVFIGPDMTVLSVDEGISNPGYFIP